MYVQVKYVASLQRSLVNNFGKEITIKLMKHLKNSNQKNQIPLNKHKLYCIHMSVYQ